MLSTVQFRYGSDNLGYLVHGEKEAIAVDGGAADDICGFLERKRLRLLHVTNTHSHGDHTCGNRELILRTGAEPVPVESLPSKGFLELEGERIRIIHTPGHTTDSVCLHHGGDLLTGDTLFNAKVGRCFTGNVEAFYRSILSLLALPDETMVYAGHDYLLEYLEKARELEPENGFIKDYRSRYDPRLLRYSLADERRVDPFIRFNEPSIIQLLDRLGLPADSEFDRFSSMLKLM